MPFIEEDTDSLGQQMHETVIKVIGVGGAGGNALNTMVNRMSGADITFIAANTDIQALNKSLAAYKLPLGSSGLGAGTKPEVGFQCANEARVAIAKMLDGADMLFLTAGMGGGTGTGASPVIAEVAREMGILTVAIVTKPFSFEGSRRMRIAEKGLEQLKDRVDSLIVVLNDRLEETLGEDASLKDCFEKADEVLYNACSSVTEMIQNCGMMNVDFRDIKTVMSCKGKALIGYGEASGPDRAVIAASQAISAPLLDSVRMRGAKGLLLNVFASTSVRASEYRAAMETAQNFADPDAIVKGGLFFDDSLGDTLRVSLIATGIEDPDQPAQAPKEAEKKPEAAPFLSQPFGVRRAKQPASEPQQSANQSGLWSSNPLGLKN